MRAGNLGERPKKEQATSTMLVDPVPTARIAARLSGPPMPDPIIMSPRNANLRGSPSLSAFDPVRVRYKKSGGLREVSVNNGEEKKDDTTTIPYMPESEIKTETKTFVNVKSTPFRQKTSPTSSSDARQLGRGDIVEGSRLPPRPAVGSTTRSHRNVAPPLRSRGRSNEPRSPPRVPRAHSTLRTTRTTKSSSPARRRPPPRPEDASPCRSRAQVLKAASFGGGASPRLDVEKESVASPNSQTEPETKTIDITASPTTPPTTPPTSTQHRTIVRSNSAPGLTLEEAAATSSDIFRLFGSSKRSNSESPRRTRAAMATSPRRTMRTNEQVIRKHETAALSPATSASATPPTSPDRSAGETNSKNNKSKKSNKSGSKSGSNKSSTFGSKILSSTEDTPPLSPTRSKGEKSNHTLSPPSSSSVSSVEPIVPSTVLATTASSIVQRGSTVDASDDCSAAASSIGSTVSMLSGDKPAGSMQTLKDLKRQIAECIGTLQEEAVMGDLEKQIEIASLIEQLASAALLVKKMGDADDEQ